MLYRLYHFEILWELIIIREIHLNGTRFSGTSKPTGKSGVPLKYILLSGNFLLEERCTTQRSTGITGIPKLNNKQPWPVVHVAATHDLRLDKTAAGFISKQWKIHRYMQKPIPRSAYILLAPRTNNSKFNMKFSGSK